MIITIPRSTLILSALALGLLVALIMALATANPAASAPAQQKSATTSLLKNIRQVAAKTARNTYALCKEANGAGCSNQYSWLY